MSRIEHCLATGMHENGHRKEAVGVDRVDALILTLKECRIDGYVLDAGECSAPLTICGNPPKRCREILHRGELLSSTVSQVIPPLLGRGRERAIPRRIGQIEER